MKDKQIEEQAKDLAKYISEEIKKQVDNKLQDPLNAVKEIAENLSKRENDLVMKVAVDSDTKKAVNELSSEEKTKAFSRALILGDKISLKALSEGVNADGGYLVPQDFYRQLVVERSEMVQMRNEVTVVPMKGKTLTIPKHDTGPEVYWTSEGASKNTTTADFSQPTITAYKMAAILYMTDELIDDAAFSLVDIMTRKFAEKLNEAEEKAIVAGSGTGQPMGIFTAATVPTIACSGNLSFNNLINLIYALPAKYRRNAKFIVHNNNIREMRKLVDGNGRYLWQDSVAVGQPATLYGYPVLESYDCPESEISFGDYKDGYWLGDRQKMTVKITNDTETTFTKDQTAIRVVQRIGGNVILPNAIRVLVSIP
jgi:HK97 family phage major capsid protein